MAHRDAARRPGQQTWSERPLVSGVAMRLKARGPLKSTIGVELPLTVDSWVLRGLRPLREGSSQCLDRVNRVDPAMSVTCPLCPQLLSSWCGCSETTRCATRCGHCATLWFCCSLRRSPRCGFSRALQHSLRRASLSCWRSRGAMFRWGARPRWSCVRQGQGKARAKASATRLAARKSRFSGCSWRYNLTTSVS